MARARFDAVRIPRRLTAIFCAILAALGLMLVTSVVTATSASALGVSGTVTGRVYIDYDSNGTYDTGNTTNGLANDVGFAGVTITAYDSTNAAVGTATSGADGTYALAVNGAATNQLRVEFTGIPAGYNPTQAGPDNGTPVQFVNVGATDVSLGILQATDYSQDNPTVAEPNMVYGDPIDGANKALPAIVGAPYTSGNGTNMYGADPSTCSASTCYASAAQVGTVWGMAAPTVTPGSDQILYSSAYYRRYAGSGPSGTGAIYRTDATTKTTTTLVDLNALFGPGTAGVDTRNSDFAVNTGSSGSALGGWINDNSYDSVGRIALGGLDVDSTGQNLFTVDLADKKLYTVPIANPSATTRSVIPLATGAAQGCVASDVIPFAVQYHNGLVYVGETCDAQSTQLASDLRAYVYTYNPATSAWSSAPVFEMPLNYTRTGGIVASGFANDASWRPWAPAGADPQNTAPTDTEPAGDFGCTFGNCLQQYPQPLLTGITFDGTNLILGLRDRYDDQSLGTNYNNGTRIVGAGAPDGDLLRACSTTGTAGSWVLEANGICGGVTGAQTVVNGGPGGNMYYDQQVFPPFGLHDYATAGAVLQIPGRAEVVSSAGDPYWVAYSGGIHFNLNSNGSFTRAWESHPDNHNAFANFGKANGIGDLAALINSAPLEIGNRVWKDLNNNGIQDAGEPGIANVTVQLLDHNGTVVATTTTDANGNYYFNNSNVPGGLLAASHYTVTLDNAPDFAAGGPLAGLALTKVNVGTDVMINSKGVPGPAPGNSPQIALTTGSAGQDNFNYDFGFSVPTCAVGQTTFIDENGNGTQDAGEPVLPGVTVALFNPNGTPATDAAGTLVTPVTTGANGKYVFDDLACGQYYETFTPPAGYTPTTQVPGSLTAVNSTPDATGKTPVFTLGSGQPDNRAPQSGDGVSVATSINPTVDAGYLPVLTFAQDKTVDLASAAPGATLTYTITAKNTSVGPATGVTGTDTLPSQVTFVSANTHGVGTYDSATGIWTIGAMAAGVTDTLTVTATVNAGVAPGTTFVNRFQLTPPTVPGATPPVVVPGHVCADNAAQSCAPTTTPTPPPPALTFAQDKTVDLASAAPGATLTYTITATNTSATDAAGVTGTDTLPSQV
ncbi:MAG TPA: SdrD B-like domain-containing protein, partial [Jatrophihabitantaceae bacterium]|nr:SdrD B-like domain-containing protein [Jatrophihabitantaceae bacterium]